MKALKSKRVNELELQALLGIDNDVDVSVRLFKYEQVENPEGMDGNVLFWIIEVRELWVSKW